VGRKTAWDLGGRVTEAPWKSQLRHCLFAKLLEEADCWDDVVQQYILQPTDEQWIAEQRTRCNLTKYQQCNVWTKFRTYEARIPNKLPVSRTQLDYVEGRLAYVVKRGKKAGPQAREDLKEYRHYCESHPEWESLAVQDAVQEARKDQLIKREQKLQAQAKVLKRF
jgi:hypothetical protein